MDKLKIFAHWFGLVCILAVSGSILIFTLSGMVDLITLRVLFVILIWIIIIGIPLSYYFGRTEARGFLSGADRVMDQVLGKTIDQMEKRNQRIRQEPMVIDQTPWIEYPVELRKTSRAQNVFDYPEDNN